MRIVAISDTHNLLSKIRIPDGDLLIHAGDLTMGGTLREIARALHELRQLPHQHKVIIAGNHDWLFQKEPALARSLVPPEIEYLQDSYADIGGLSIWGSPWQPWFCDWAFNGPRDGSLKHIWSMIPDKTDILITHGPPAGHGDTLTDGNQVGCVDLRDAVARIRPKLHVFGHIHEGHGTTTNGHTKFVNASICDEAYRPILTPIVIDL